MSERKYLRFADIVRGVPEMAVNEAVDSSDIFGGLSLSPRGKERLRKIIELNMITFLDEYGVRSINYIYLRSGEEYKRVSLR